MSHAPPPANAVPNASALSPPVPQAHAAAFSGEAASQHIAALGERRADATGSDAAAATMTDEEVALQRSAARARRRHLIATHRLPHSAALEALL